MANLLTRLGRWLISPRPPARVRVICDLCDRGHHVHDVNSGGCITPECECEVDR